MCDHRNRILCCSYVGDKRIVEGIVCVDCAEYKVTRAAWRLRVGVGQYFDYPEFHPDDMTWPDGAHLTLLRSKSPKATHAVLGGLARKGRL